jgi:WD40 repeat protein
MATAPFAPSFYAAGGTLRGDSPSYVQRKADDDLYEGLLRGEFCYVLTARQMGKSSLMMRAAARLQASRTAVAILDLTAIGQNLTPEQWYGGLIMQLGYRLGLADEVMSFWLAEQALGPLQRWMKTIRDVILPRLSERMVIFIDEIDVVRSLPFPADEFFAGIRECYNQRSQNPEMERLSFGLFGVASPTDLIRDTRITPFNIGRRIELHDFTVAEAAPLARGLGIRRDLGDAILKRILYWTGGHPYLTQRMCLEMIQADKVRGPAQVDDLCAALFFSHRAQERDDNLLFVRERMLRSELDQAGLLDLYRRIRTGSTVNDDGMNPLAGALQLAGIVRTIDGRLRVRNRIYSRVFDRAWIEAVMPDAELKRQKAAFRRGIWRTATVAAFVVAIITTLIAFRQARASRRLLYDADIRLAQEAWNHSDTDRVEELLQANAPESMPEDLRGFEWFMFQKLIHEEVWGFGEPYRILASTLSSDGKLLYLGEYRQNSYEPNILVVKVYDLALRRGLTKFEVPTDASYPQVLFSADRKYAMISGQQHTIEQWDIRTATRVATFTGHPGSLYALALSADGNVMASGDSTGMVRLWDIRKRKEMRTLARQRNRPRSLALSPNGGMLAIANESRRIGVWDVNTGREIKQFDIRMGKATFVAFLPGGTSLLTAAQDGVMQFWDLGEMRVVQTLSGHSGSISSIAFSPDGQLLATGSVDRTVRLWSVANGRELRTIRGHGASVNSVSFSSDGRYLITGAFDQSVKVWNIANRPEALRLPAEAQRYLSTTFSPSNELLALGISEDNHSNLWNISTGRKIAQLTDFGDELLCAAFSSDSKLLATGGNDGQMTIWNVDTGRLLWSRKGHSKAIYAVAFSPNGKSLISGGEDRKLLLWSIATGEEEAHLKSDLDNSYLAVFSPDGRLIASGTREGAVQLWDVAARRVLRTFRGHSGNVRAIAFSPDGKTLVTGADDHQVRLWNVSDGRLLSTLGLADVVQRAVFSPENNRLITGGTDGTIGIWDLASGQQLMTLPGHTDEVKSIVFSPDGGMLATSSTDGLIRLWRTR